MSSILAEYYDLLTEIIIANGSKIKIDPDIPYTVTFYQDDRTLAQSTGIIRGIIGETHVISMIPLNKENSNYATIIDTYKIESIKTYTFNAHFTDFNNWVGVEVTENQSINMRIKYGGGESIVTVEQNKLYDVSYVTSANGEKYLTNGIGRVVSILRNAVRSAMPINHSGHLTNPQDYIIQFDFGQDNFSDIKAVNVLDIRVIREYIPAKLPVDSSELKIFVSIEEQMHRLDQPELYVHHTFDKYKDAMMRAYAAIRNPDITEQQLTRLTDELKRAVDGLRLVAYDKDLIEYDEEKNILYCNESPMTLVILGTEFDYQIVKYYTAFGARKKLRIKKNVSLFYTYAHVDYDNISLKQDPEYEKLCPECLEIANKFKANHEQCSIIAVNASFGSVFLGKSFGYADIVDKDGNNYAVRPDGTTFLYGACPTYARFNNCTIEQFFLGGATKNTISDGNKAYFKSCHVALAYCGSYNDEFVTDGASELEETIKDELITYDRGSLDISDSTFEMISCTGIDSSTDIITLDIHGQSKIGRICGAFHGSKLNHADIFIRHMSRVNSVNILYDESEITGLFLLRLSDFSNIGNVLVGAEAAGASHFKELIDNKVMVSINLSDHSFIDNIKRGYDGETLVPKEKVLIDIPTCKVNHTDGFDDIPPSKDESSNTSEDSPVVSPEPTTEPDAPSVPPEEPLPDIISKEDPSIIDKDNVTPSNDTDNESTELVDITEDTESDDI